MKASSATSAPTTAAPAAPADSNAPRSARKRQNPPSPIVDGFTLAGISSLPDRATNAYRKDLADAALAGQVIASHYAEPLARTLSRDAELRAEPDEGAEAIMTLKAGETLHMLDNSRGWAWGYGPDGRVGYVPSAAIAN